MSSSLNITEDSYIAQINYSEGRFQGEIRRFAINGLGIFIWKNGDCYYGDWKDGKMQGKGIYCYGSGEYLEGHFIDSIAHGKGCLKFPDGSFILGTFQKGRLSGKSLKYVAIDSTWRIEKYSDGRSIETIYEGRGKPSISEIALAEQNECINTILIATAKYENNIGPDSKHKSVDSIPSVVEINFSTRFFGMAKNGIPEGLGLKISSNEIECGNFFQGKLNGNGRRLVVGNSLYIGEFLKGMHNGEGQIFDRAIMKKFTGFFENGEMVREESETSFKIEELNKSPEIKSQNPIDQAFLNIRNYHNSLYEIISGPSESDEFDYIANTIKDLIRNGANSILVTDPLDLKDKISEISGVRSQAGFFSPSKGLISSPDGFKHTMEQILEHPSEILKTKVSSRSNTPTQMEKYDEYSFRPVFNVGTSCKNIGDISKDQPSNPSEIIYEIVLPQEYKSTSPHSQKRCSSKSPPNQPRRKSSFGANVDPFNPVVDKKNDSVLRSISNTLDNAETERYVQSNKIPLKNRYQSTQNDLDKTFEKGKTSDDLIVYRLSESEDTKNIIQRNESLYHGHDLEYSRDSQRSDIKRNSSPQKKGFLKHSSPDMFKPQFIRDKLAEERERNLGSKNHSSPKSGKKSDCEVNIRSPTNIFDSFSKDCSKITTPFDSRRTTEANTSKPTQPLPLTYVDYPKKQQGKSPQSSKQTKSNSKEKKTPFNHKRQISLTNNDGKEIRMEIQPADNSKFLKSGKSANSKASTSQKKSIQPNPSERVLTPRGGGQDKADRNYQLDKSNFSSNRSPNSKDTRGDSNKKNSSLQDSLIIQKVITFGKGESPKNSGYQKITEFISSNQNSDELSTKVYSSGKTKFSFESLNPLQTLKLDLSSPKQLMIQSALNSPSYGSNQGSESLTDRLESSKKSQFDHLKLTLVTSKMPMTARELHSPTSDRISIASPTNNSFLSPKNMDSKTKGSRSQNGGNLSSRRPSGNQKDSWKYANSTNKDSFYKECLSPNLSPDRVGVYKIEVPRSENRSISRGGSKNKLSGMLSKSGKPSPRGAPDLAFLPKNLSQVNSRRPSNSPSSRTIVFEDANAKFKLVYQEKEAAKVDVRETSEERRRMLKDHSYGYVISPYSIQDPNNSKLSPRVSRNNSFTKNQSSFPLTKEANLSPSKNSSYIIKEACDPKTKLDYYESLMVSPERRSLIKKSYEGSPEIKKSPSKSRNDLIIGASLSDHAMMDQKVLFNVSENQSEIQYSPKFAANKKQQLFKPDTAINIKKIEKPNLKKYSPTKRSEQTKKVSPLKLRSDSSQNKEEIAIGELESEDFPLTSRRTEKDDSLALTYLLNTDRSKGTESGNIKALKSNQAIKKPASNHHNKSGFAGRQGSLSNILEVRSPKEKENIYKKNPDPSAAIKKVSTQNVTPRERDVLLRRGSTPNQVKGLTQTFMRPKLKPTVEEILSSKNESSILKEVSICVTPVVQESMQQVDDVVFGKSIPVASLCPSYRAYKLSNPDSKATSRINTPGGSPNKNVAIKNQF